MPLRQPPNFKAVDDRLFEIPQPAIGGINLKDLEYEQEVSQSPYMLNMMYRNGAFSKRYGQEIYKEYSEEVYAMIIYRNRLIVHSGTKMYSEENEIANSLPERKGLFVLFNQNLYYICDNIYCYNGETWNSVEPYIPTIVINRKPDGSGGDTSEAYNMLGTGFQNNFHGDGTSTEYKLTDTDLDNVVPKVTVDNEEWTYDANLSAAKTFKVDYTAGKITLKSAAPSGTNNVEIIAYKHDSEWDDYHNQIVNSKYYSCFGGNNNSRLFLAGGGKSTYYYSEVYDASYFPYTNYAKVGNGADDITGFGQQYNVLLIFKPTEIYSLTYYQNTASTTTDESQIGIGSFASQIVNAAIGCDCPNTIQLINNQLTWFSSRAGICTLISTNIVDERNVRVISRNIEKTNNMNVVGIMDIDIFEGDDSLREDVTSVDYDDKYFLVFPKRFVKNNDQFVESDYGICYVWDYGISPYITSSNRLTHAKELAYFLFDHFYVKQFLRINSDLIYCSSKDGFKNKLIRLNLGFSDVNYDGLTDEEGILLDKIAIDAYYMTPFFQFNAVEYLKTIKNIYIQCRGDTSTVIDVYYATDETNDFEQDPESIRIGGKIWEHFSWETFEWFIVNHANTFRRKCSLKKIQMASFFFKNNMVERDLSITHISLQYQIVKYVK